MLPIDLEWSWSEARREEGRVTRGEMELVGAVERKGRRSGRKLRVIVTSLEGDRRSFIEKEERVGEWRKREKGGDVLFWYLSLLPLSQSQRRNNTFL